MLEHKQTNKTIIQALNANAYNIYMFMASLFGNSFSI